MPNSTRDGLDIAIRVVEERKEALRLVDVGDASNGVPINDLISRAVRAQHHIDACDAILSDLIKELEAADA